MSNYIFSYVSLVPFDKQELLMYITNYKADYKVYFFDLMAFNKNALCREDTTSVRVDIICNEYNIEFYRIIRYNMKSNLAISNFIPRSQYFTHTAILFCRNPHAFCTFCSILSTLPYYIVLNSVYCNTV